MVEILFASDMGSMPVINARTFLVASLPSSLETFEPQTCGNVLAPKLCEMQAGFGLGEQG